MLFHLLCQIDGERKSHQRQSLPARYYRGSKILPPFFFFFLVKSQRSDQTAFCSGVADALLSKAHFGGYSTGVAVAVRMDQWTLNLLSDSFHVKANHHSLIVNEYLNKAPVKMACLKMDAQIIHAH